MSHALDPETAALLRRARERLAAADAQTRWAFARDAAGHRVAAVSPQATSWCVVGAVMMEAQPQPSPVERAAGRALPRFLLEKERRSRERHAHAVLSRALALLDAAANGHAPRLSPAAWLNNTADREATLAMIDRAIQRAEARSLV